MRKNNYNLIAFLLSFLLAIAAAAPALALEDISQENDKIVILHTNDIHCKIEQSVSDNAITNIGFAGVAAYKSEMAKTYGTENVTLVDVGDAISGGIIGSLTSGRSIIEIMNQTGYDLAVPGNHEFDYRVKGLLTLANEVADFPYICSNFIDLLTGISVFDAYKIISYGMSKSHILASALQKPSESAH